MGDLKFSVQDLIDMLNKIEDKKKVVFLVDDFKYKNISNLFEDDDYVELS